MTAVVIDTTVLSNFAQIEQPRLLAKDFQQPVTVRAVLDELMVGLRSNRVPIVEWDWLTVIELSTAEAALAERLGQAWDVVKLPVSPLHSREDGWC